MKKEFIPYQEALALKELGFEEECFGKYYYVREHEVYDPKKGEDFMFGDNNRILLKDNPCNYGYDSNEITVCVAPLYQQAFKFFREEYKINSFISFETIDDSETAYVWNIIKYLPEGKDRKKDTWDFYDRIDSFSRMSWYNTYEEAELECLKKLIEIAQKQK